MPDNKRTTESGPSPFEAYQTSLRRMKAEAAEACKAVEVLEKLRRTFPLWWQMYELKKRDIPCQPFQKWQKEASKALDSIKGDIKSGELYRINKGYKKIKKTYDKLNEARKSIKRNIEEEKEKKEDEEIKLKNETKEKLENLKEKKSKKRKKLISRVNTWAVTAAVLGFIVGCSQELSSGLVGLLAGPVVWFIGFKLTVPSGIENLKHKIERLEKEKRGREREIRNVEENINDLRSYNKSILSVCNKENNRKVRLAEEA